MMINSRTSLDVLPFPINEEKSMDVDWTELPQEMIELISKRLTIYSDYLRFRCVCSRWNSSAPKTPLHLPPQFPWLMLSHKSFFDPSTEKIHHLSLPLSSSHTTRICGSSFGWLVIVDEISAVRLLNPITHVTLSLPSLSTLPPYFVNNILNKVVLSSSPSLSDDFTAFAIFNFQQLAFCREGYDSWVLFNVNRNIKWIDAVSKNKLFYVVGTKGMIAVCDVEGPRVSIIETTTSVNFWNFRKVIYSVIFSGEDMLVVYRCILYEYQPLLILKMNWNTLSWEEIRTLGENMLFVGWRYCVSLSATDFAGCHSNRIYITHGIIGNANISIFSLSDKRIELLSRLPLRADKSLGCPIWVTPNPQ